MDAIWWAGQTAGLLSGAGYLWAGGARTRLRTLIISLTAEALGVVSFLLLARWALAAVIAVIIVRTWVQYRYGTNPARSWWIASTLNAATVATYLLVNGWPATPVAWMPVAGVLLSGFAFAFHNLVHLKLTLLVCTATWFVYKLIEGLLGSALMEIPTAAATLFALWVAVRAARSPRAS